MASNMLSPGVKITISDYSDYVAETSTSALGLVGGARRGPTTPTLVTSRDDAIKLYGNPTTKDFGIYSLLAALEYADTVYYERIVKPATKATTGDNNSKLLFYGLNESELYNGAKISVTGTESSFTVEVNLDDTKETYNDCTLDNVESKINGISKILTVKVNTAEGSSFKAAKYELDGGAVGAKFGTTPESDDINFTTIYYDSTLNGVEIRLSEKDFLDRFDYTLVDTKGNVLEELSQLTLDQEDDRFIETYINNNSTYIHCSYNLKTKNDVTNSTYKIGNGNDGLDGLGTSEVITGLEQFDNPETMEIDILAAPGWSDPSVINKGISICETRQDCLFLIDPPFGLKAQQVVDWSNCQGDYKRPDSSAYDSSYAAIYWPWVKIYDTFTSDYLWLPPSGYVASQIAYSDSQSEPWFAPAGLNRGLLKSPVDIEYSPTKGERDILYGKSNVVNPLVNFKSNGLVIWGQKTTQRKYSSLNRVNVRRLVNYLKRTINASTNYFLFDPNDEQLWNRWVDMVEPMLESIKNRRGIYDYKIIMDETTVTADDIANNRMPGIIKFKPTRAAEFIPLNFMIMPYGASFVDDEL